MKSAIILRNIILLFLICSISALCQWNIDVVNNSGNVGLYSSIDFDSTGNPHIVYQNASSHDLQYSRWDSLGWVVELVSAGSSSIRYGQYCDIKLDKDGYPHISYLDSRYPSSAAGPCYSYKNESGWHHNRDYIWDGVSTIGSYCSIDLYYDIGSDITIPFIAFQFKGLCMAKKDTSGNIVWERIDASSATGRWTSIGVLNQDNIFISYYDVNGQDLKLAFYNGIGWTTEIIDTTGNSGMYSSLELDENGNPLITYYQILPGETEGRLVYTTWNNR